MNLFEDQIKLEAIEITYSEFRKLERQTKFEGSLWGEVHPEDDICVILNKANEDIVAFFSINYDGIDSDDLPMAYVIISSEYRGLSLLSKVYKSALKLFRLETVYAWVEPHNIASIKAHKKIGYITRDFVSPSAPIGYTFIINYNTL